MLGSLLAASLIAQSPGLTHPMSVSLAAETINRCMQGGFGEAVASRKGQPFAVYVIEDRVEDVAIDTRAVSVELAKLLEYSLMKARVRGQEKLSIKGALTSKGEGEARVYRLSIGLFDTSTRQRLALCSGTYPPADAPEQEQAPPPGWLSTPLVIEAKPPRILAWGFSQSGNLDNAKHTARLALDLTLLALGEHLPEARQASLADAKDAGSWSDGSGRYARLVLELPATWANGVRAYLQSAPKVSATPPPWTRGAGSAHGAPTAAELVKAADAKALAKAGPGAAVEERWLDPKSGILYARAE